MTTKRIKIYIDMDGVLVDFDEGMVRKTTPMLNRIHAELARAEERLQDRFPDEIAHFIKKNAGAVEKDQVFNRFVRSLKGTPDGETQEAKAFKKIYNTARGARVQIYAKPGYYLDLKPMGDMRELLAFVRTIDPDPSILTAPISGKPEAVEGCCQEKRDWVKVHIPDFTGEVICDDQKYKYANPEPNTVKILIDDRSKNLDPWREAGGIAVMHTSAASTIAKLKELSVKKLLETYIREVVVSETTALPTKLKAVSYTGVVLTEKSRNALLAMFPSPEGWDTIAHHMTINMGPYKGDRAIIGQTVQLNGVAFGSDDKVTALAVESPTVHSQNANPHITLAVNRSEGGKPVMSNKLTNWKPLKTPISLEGIVEEVPQP